MKLNDKMWWRILVVLTGPVWMSVGILLILVAFPIGLIANLVYGLYTYIKDGEWEELLPL